MRSQLPFLLCAIIAFHVGAHCLAHADNPTTSPAEHEPGKLWLRFAANTDNYDARMISMWRHGWDKFAERVESEVKELEQREEFNVYGIQVHHPWGRSIVDGEPQVMEFQQRKRCQEDFQRSGNTILERALDDAAFVRAMNSLSKDHRLMIYMGGPRQLRPLPDETKLQWVERAKEVYGPVLQITPPCAIGMDYTFGQPTGSDPLDQFYGGAEGAVAMLTRDLVARGHVIYYEGAILLKADWALRLCSTYTTEQWWWVPAGGHVHEKPDWGRWARMQEETHNTTMIQLQPRKDDDERRKAIERNLKIGRDVTIELTECPGWPWN
jgi:hypothetical protein